jgi:hypothetical protein
MQADSGFLEGHLDLQPPEAKMRKMDVVFRSVDGFRSVQLKSIITSDSFFEQMLEPVLVLMFPPRTRRGLGWCDALKP